MHWKLLLEIQQPLPSSYTSVYYYYV